MPSLAALKCRSTRLSDNASSARNKRGLKENARVPAKIPSCSGHSKSRDPASGSYYIVPMMSGARPESRSSSAGLIVARNSEAFALIFCASAITSRKSCSAGTTSPRGLQRRPPQQSPLALFASPALIWPSARAAGPDTNRQASVPCSPPTIY